MTFGIDVVPPPDPAIDWPPVPALEADVLDTLDAPPALEVDALDAPPEPFIEGEWLHAMTLTTTDAAQPQTREDFIAGANSNGRARLVRAAFVDRCDPRDRRLET
ncbi:Hypothetical protein A7982_02206 [Minicystis rosea]|nr:Hypothetical protein A7982_02206 [Minicystis rosea]